MGEYKQYSLNFECRGDSIEAFNDLKKLQEVGFADDTATITLNHVRVPAGCLETVQDFISVYRSLVEKNRDEIREFALAHAGSMDYDTFLEECNRALNNGNVFAEKEGDRGFTAAEMDAIINEAGALVAQQAGPRL